MSDNYPNGQNSTGSGDNVQIGTGNYQRGNKVETNGGNYVGGDSLQTNGGNYVHNQGGHYTQGDSTYKFADNVQYNPVAGDQFYGDKIGGDKVSGNKIQTGSGSYIGSQTNNNTSTFNGTANTNGGAFIQGGVTTNGGNNQFGATGQTYQNPQYQPNQPTGYTPSNHTNQYSSPQPEVVERPAYESVVVQPTQTRFRYGLNSPIFPFEEIRFNLKKGDPLKGPGHNYAHYDRTAVYEVEPQKHQTIIADLYNKVYDKLMSGHVQAARNHIDVVDLNEETAPNEPARRYIRVQGETLRNAHMSVFATFRSSGGFLYLSTNSFLTVTLNQLEIWKSVLLQIVPVIVLAIISIIALSIAAQQSSRSAYDAYYGSSYGTGSSTQPWLVPVIILVVVLTTLICLSLLKVIRRKAKEKRWRETQALFGSAFNNDDMNVFYNTFSVLILHSIAEVFEHHKIEAAVEGINRIIQNINTNGGAFVVGGITTNGGDNSFAASKN